MATGLASKTSSSVSFASTSTVFARIVRSSVLVVSRRARRAMSASRAASRRPAFAGETVTLVSVRFSPASTGSSACLRSMRPMNEPMAERSSVTFAGRFSSTSSPVIVRRPRSRNEPSRPAAYSRATGRLDVDVHARPLRGQRVARVAELHVDRARDERGHAAVRARERLLLREAADVDARDLRARRAACPAALPSAHASAPTLATARVASTTATMMAMRVMWTSLGASTLPPCAGVLRVAARRTAPRRLGAALHSNVSRPAGPAGG